MTTSPDAIQNCLYNVTNYCEIKTEICSLNDDRVYTIFYVHSN